jgi:hypothetical protein
VLDPRSLERWRRGSAIGAVLAAVSLGLRDVLGPSGREPVVEDVDPLAPDAELTALELHLDPLYPAASWAVVRPHLFARRHHVPA